MTLEQELSNVRSYLQIQQLMHDGDFDVEIDVAAEILQYESLNLFYSHWLKMRLITELT